MNYLRIYEQLIEHRKILPKISDMYYEIHHILPRCLGGDDSPENLIHLTAEDHFVAHLLLAQIYGGKLWFAVNAMRMETAGRTIKNRSTFALMKKKHSENMSGENNWAYDFKDYTVVNIDTLEEFTGKRIDIERYLKTSNPAVCQIVAGKMWVTKNHCLKENLHKIKRRDQTVYDFYNLKEKKVVKGTYYNVADNYNVSRKHIQLLSQEKMSEAYGFILHKNLELVKYFNTKTGEIFTCTQQEVCINHGISSAHYCILKTGEAISAKNIAIFDAYKQHVSNEIVYTIEDIKTKEIFITTRKILVNSGRIDSSNFSKLYRYEQKTAKGLRLLSKSNGTWH